MTLTIKENCAACNAGIFKDDEFTFPFDEP